MPKQEEGVRRARPLPYSLLVSDATNATGVTIILFNNGTAGMSLSMYDLHATATAPRKYTVEAGKTIVDVRPIVGAYNW